MVIRSKHVDHFQHDGIAAGYDAEALDETDPIRSGYRAVLTWVAARVAQSRPASILELGVGTGTLTAMLPTCDSIVCIDASREMIQIAQTKLAERPDVEFVLQDVLEFLTRGRHRFEAIVSTYTLHHLTEDEKEVLLSSAAASLAPAGRLIVGDLMFRSPRERARILRQLEAEGRADTMACIDEEFFWDLQRTAVVLQRLGMSHELKRFSLFSWAFAAHVPA